MVRVTTNSKVINLVYTLVATSEEYFGVDILVLSH